MALTKEWRHRIMAWRQELSKHLYQPLGGLALEAAFTLDQLTLAEAQTQLSFEPIAPGTPWGAKWEYGWFRGEVTIPEAAQGQMVALMPDVGIEPTMTIEIIGDKVTPILTDTVAEAVVYVNGDYAGAIDHKHKVILLTDSARAGESFSIVLEAYAGHGPPRVAYRADSARPRDRAGAPSAAMQGGAEPFWDLDGAGLPTYDGRGNALGYP